MGDKFTVQIASREDPCVVTVNLCHSSEIQNLNEQKDQRMLRPGSSRLNEGYHSLG